MANVLINESTMREIGNAIRLKTGKKDLILPKDMAGEIEGIKAGTSAELINSVINRAVTDIYIDTPVGRYAFCECRYVKPTFGDNCTKIGNYAFGYIESVTEINTNRVAIIEQYAFDRAKNLSKADLPYVIRIGSYAFYGAQKLTRADLPRVIDISSYVFMGSGLQAIILRGDSICTLSNTNAFDGTPIAKGTGYIYVPKDLIEQYKESTNWVVLADQFRAIEDYPDIAGGMSLASKTSMKNVLIDEDTMTSIGNAIRSKTKKEDMILPKDMPSEIQSMSTGGDTRVLHGIINKSIKDICIDTPIGDYAFYDCKFVKPTFGDNCTKIGYEPFYYCYAIEEINTNKVTEIGSYAFFGSKNLSKADLPNVTKIGSAAFNWTKLETLILRIDKICSISSYTPFSGTPIEKGEGYIYVPQALIEQYKVASNWSKYAAQFRAIEDYPEITEVNN